VPEGPAVLDDGRRRGEGLILRVELVGGPPRVWSKIDLTVHRLRRKAVQIKWLIGFAGLAGWGTRIRT
jgi:hypothetical protein